MPLNTAVTNGGNHVILGTFEDVMKSPTIHTLRLVFSLFLLVLILLMLGYALYNLAGGFSRGPQGEGVVISDVPVEVVTSIVGAFVGVAGLIVTSIFSWRADRRKEKYFEMEMERQRFEIEKLKLQLELLRGEPANGGQDQPIE